MGARFRRKGIQPDLVIDSERRADDPLAITREKDLEGHLPAEGKSVSPGAQLYRKPGAPTVARNKSYAGPRTAAEVPDDPVTGNDFPLSIAYQSVRGMLAPPKN